MKKISEKEALILLGDLFGRMQQHFKVAGVESRFFGQFGILPRNPQIAEVEDSLKRINELINYVGPLQKKNTEKERAASEKATAKLITKAKKEDPLLSYKKRTTTRLKPKLKDASV